MNCNPQSDPDYLKLPQVMSRGFQWPEHSGCFSNMEAFVVAPLGGKKEGGENPIA